jgi:hypothetical protein
MENQGFRLVNDIVTNLVEYRNHIEEYELKSPWLKTNTGFILSAIIEKELEQRIKNKPVVNDEPSVQERLDVIYKLFCYYQDKCIDLEKMNSAIRDFSKLLPPNPAE